MSSAGLHKLLRVSSHHFGQYWQFMSDIIISHACEDDIMFTCTLSGYSSPERVNIIINFNTHTIGTFSILDSYQIFVHIIANNTDVVNIIVNIIRSIP